MGKKYQIIVVDPPWKVKKDEEMGNNGGGTEAIRLALKSRV